MELERLEEFRLIAEEKSIKNAAEKLGLSTATLSARMKTFEKELGASLFRPVSGGVELTEAGERLLMAGQRLLDTYAGLRAELSGTQRHSYKSLRIAVSGLDLPLFLGPFLDEVNRRNPSVHLELLDDSRHGVESGILSGDVDIYFASAMEDYCPAGLKKVRIAPSSQYVLMPQSHPLAARGSVSLRELDGERFIPYPATAETSIRDFQERNLAAAGIKYSFYESATSPLFFTLLVPIGKGLILLPSPIMNVPPNAVLVPISGIKYPAAGCFFFYPNSKNPEALSFAAEYEAFTKEALRREHRPSI